MSPSKSWIVAGVAFVLAAIVFTEARAGNVMSPTPPAYQVYHVEIPLGYGATWASNPSDPGELEAIMVDDITYNVHLDPCDPAERCLTFSIEATGPWYASWVDDYPGEVADNPGGPDYEWWYVPIPGAPDWVMVRWADARGTDFTAHVVDMATPTSMIIDGISHSLYGQVMGRLKYIEGVYTPAETLSATVAMCQTSESRHYQTPYILQAQTIAFRDYNLPSGTSSYVDARVFVKGRIFFTDSNPPLRNFNWTVAELP